MRGEDAQPTTLFSYIALEDRIPADHPLRVIRTLIDPMLVALSPRFDTLYLPQGRRSIAPEKLLPRPAAAGALHHSERAAAHGATPVQPAVPLVRGAGDR
jgi:hypothetical protein